MNIKHVRIDNRLVHGQVVVTWLQATGADTIVVANDVIAADDFQKTMLLAVTPPAVKRELILSVAETLAYLADPAHAEERIFVLVKEPADALRLKQGGLDVKTMNVGNMAFVVGSKKVTNTVYVSSRDVEACKALIAAGVELTAQMMPTGARNDFMQLLRKAKLV
jgi:Phosphotransferase system, mannose/fructose/N-acetylgalactosamine-specific component IIB